jgi:predicted Zn-dependent protease
LYISRFWYTNWVNPKEAIITGMTRDGTFRIRGGRLAGPVQNTRFQCRLLDLLQTCEAVGSDGRLQGIVAPSMLVGSFNIASATLF